MTGIYILECKSNGKNYIGSASNIESRWRTHKSLLQRNRHSNPHLQNAWQLYGAESFDFVVVELSSKAELCGKEQYWMDLLDASNQSLGFNISKTARSLLGYRHSEETKAKISRANRGLKRSLEFCEQMSELNRGEKHRQWGKPLSDEHKEKLLSSIRGKKKTEEHKKRLSESHKGHPGLRGERASRSKLTWDQVREIRRLRSEEGFTLIRIATLFDITFQTVSEIALKKTWKEEDNL